jgi:hypothetical protein
MSSDVVSNINDFAYQDGIIPYGPKKGHTFHCNTQCVFFKHPKWIRCLKDAKNKHDIYDPYNIHYPEYQKMFQWMRIHILRYELDEVCQVRFKQWGDYVMFPVKNYSYERSSSKTYDIHFDNDIIMRILY